MVFGKNQTFFCGGVENRKCLSGKQKRIGLEKDIKTIDSKKENTVLHRFETMRSSYVLNLACLLKFETEQDKIATRVNLGSTRKKL